MRLRLTMRPHGWLLPAAMLAGLCVTPARADTFPLGRWLTQDREGVVEIARCGAGFCGRIVGMLERRGPDGLPPHDPDGRPQCGLVILRESEQAGPDFWRGRITNPEDNSVWRCELRLEDGVLRLRGYVLIPLLGRTQDWTRYGGSIGPDCTMG